MQNHETNSVSLAQNICCVTPFDWQICLHRVRDGRFGGGKKAAAVAPGRRDKRWTETTAEKDTDVPPVCLSPPLRLRLRVPPLV